MRRNTVCRIPALLIAAALLCAGRVAVAQTVPPPWVGADIGGPTIQGTSAHSAGTFTISAGGTDIWGSADQFHFIYQPITGDLDVIARVASLTRADAWSKAGVMIRESLAAGSRHAMVAASAAQGYTFQRRLETAGLSISTAGPSTGPPGWVRLVRTGDVFKGYHSANNITWTLIGTEVIPMGDTVYVGLPVTSHDPQVAAVAVMDAVTVTPLAPTPNNPPAVSIMAPASGSRYTAPASIAINAAATDPEGALASVEFYADQTMVKRDTVAPYTARWATSTPGTYSLTAVAHDADGGRTISAAVSVTVTSNSAPSVTLSSPTNGATFAAPATINLAATASDPENQLARVEFLSGTSVLATDTTAPFAFTWSNVAAGTYTITARAYRQCWSLGYIGGGDGHGERAEWRPVGHADQSDQWCDVHGTGNHQLDGDGQRSGEPAGARGVPLRQRRAGDRYDRTLRVQLDQCRGGKLHTDRASLRRRRHWGHVIGGVDHRHGADRTGAVDSG